MERRIGADALPGWRETPAKQAVLDFVREQVDRDRHGGRLVGRLPAALADGARTRRYPTWAPRPAQYGARSWRLSTLPEPVRGSSAAKSTERGTL